jgi:hypothetical protein
VEPELVDAFVETADADLEPRGRRPTRSEELDGHGVVTRRTVRMIRSGRLEPHETRALLEEADFRSADVFGDVERTPFDASARTQIGRARKPTLG